MHLTPIKIAKQPGISWSSIWRMVKNETLTVEVRESTTNEGRDWKQKNSCWLPYLKVTSI